jgi:hypothetical protein
MDLQRILNTPLRQQRFPSEIPETPQQFSETSPLSEVPETPLRLHTPFRLSQISTQSWDSQLGPRPENLSNSQEPPSEEPPSQEPPSTPIKRSYYTSRDERIAIRTALLFNTPYKDICEKLKVTERQIWYTKNHRLTPQKNRAGRHPLLRTPEKQELKTWILKSPSHRRVAFHKIPRCMPLLQSNNIGEKAVRTA